MEDHASQFSVVKERRLLKMDCWKTAHHSHTQVQTAESASSQFAITDRDSFHKVSAKTVNHTPELSMMENLVLHASQLKEKSFRKMVPVRSAQTLQELCGRLRNVDLLFVMQDNFSKLMEDALTATHTPEDLLMEEVAFLMNARILKDLVKMEIVSHALSGPELKVMEPHVAQILAVLDKESWKMELVNTAHSTPWFAKIKDAVITRNVHLIRSNTKMVLVKNVHSMKWYLQMD